MTIKQFLRVVEIRTKVVSISALLIGTLLVWRYEGPLDWLRCILMWLAALAVDMATTALNTFYDHEKGVDNRRFNVEKDKVLVHEAVAPGAALLTAVALYALAAVLGLMLSFLAGWQVLVVGLAGMAVGYLYNAGPLPLSRTPLGEVFAGGFLGLALIVLTVFVLQGQVSSAGWWVALPSFFLVASILTVNNTCDMEGDREAGRRTLSILVGLGIARFLIPGLGLLAWGAVAWGVSLGIFAAWSLLPLGLGVLISIPLYVHMDRRGYSHRTKGPSMGSISLIFVVYTMAMVVALILGRAVQA